MQLGRAFRDCLRSHFQAIVDVVCVGVWLSRSAIEAAEFAVGVADICRVEMPVNVEVGRAAVPSPSHEVCKFTECGKVVSGLQSDAVSKGEPFSRRDALSYLVQLFVV